MDESFTSAAPCDVSYLQCPCLAEADWWLAIGFFMSCLDFFFGWDYIRGFRIAREAAKRDYDDATNCTTLAKDVSTGMLMFKKEYLGSIHIFVLATILRRPIVVYSDASAATDAVKVGPTEDEDTCGIYLPCPALVPRERWETRHPLALLYNSQHFTAMCAVQNVTRCVMRLCYGCATVMLRLCYGCTTLYHGQRSFSSWPSRPNSAFHYQGVPCSRAEVEVLWLPIGRGWSRSTVVPRLFLLLAPVRLL